MPDIDRQEIRKETMVGEQSWPSCLLEAHGDPGARRGEPVTVGIPFPPDFCPDANSLEVLDGSGLSVPHQVEVLDRWPGGSIRWGLFDLCVDSGASYRVVRSEGRRAVHATEIRVEPRGGGFEVQTGPASFMVSPRGPTVLQEIAPARRSVSLDVRDERDVALECRFTRCVLETAGPLRVTILLESELRSPTEVKALVIIRLSLFRASSVARLAVTVRNPRRAEHAGNFWELGDPGSIYFRDISLRLDTGSEIRNVECWPETQRDSRVLAAPMSIYQDSSGGERWRSSTHVNREGRVPVTFRGYRVIAPGLTAEGLRAEPVVRVIGASGESAVCIRHFWQNFPKAITAEATGMSLGLFPRAFDDVHELQGGEQKTHTIGIAFGRDPVSDVPLDWIRQPSLVCASPEWYAAAQAVPYLTPAARDPNETYRSLVAAAIDGPDTFELKRERIDEYGWRNFGDIYADHEAVFHKGPEPLVSHYNNQYDAIAGFSVQFFRTRDPRWWRAMEELAAHVVDIDLYHTSVDKAAYSGGYFWHTFHYKDAGRSTHRAYPKAPGVDGGGASNEHNYTTGLMLHYFLTGSATSREAVLQLADWVLQIDDGRRTVFKWLSRSDTGLASSTAEAAYHGPGRGPANSIVTLLNAFRLTARVSYLKKAEQLIHRCIHPADAIADRDLLNAERRWSYVVFLQALGRYLDEKALRGEYDCEYEYARASLVHYAGWMAEHEYPYLEKPEILEYPTETWAAQDVRKSEVFAFAARHANGAVRERFLGRSSFFFDTSLATLAASPTRSLARPVVLLLSYGHSHAALHDLARRAAAATLPSDCNHGTPAVFVPQKQQAVRRAFGVAVAGGVTVVVVALWLMMM
jgi:hypothetical protein